MNLYTLAQRFVGLAEIAGPKNNGFVQWAHSLCGLDPETPDEVPWCSSFLNAIAWMLRLPRSKSAAARSWLAVGVPVPLDQAKLGDVVVFARGPEPQPGPDVLKAPGHVALFAGREGIEYLLVLGGNQGNTVSVARYLKSKVLGVRRIE